MKFDRKIYFDSVRASLFAGSLSQEQVDGQNALLEYWEREALSEDLRHFAYILATTKHETASTMLPITEYGKGAGKDYGVTDLETGQVYYGRGYVQLTWRENYRNADKKLGYTGAQSMEWCADNALIPAVAARVIGRGMWEGWFRDDAEGRQTLRRYFDIDSDDPYGARDIVNGDANKVPSWSGGKSIGTLVAEYHTAFLEALSAARIEDHAPPFIPVPRIVPVKIYIPAGVEVHVEEIKE